MNSATVNSVWRFHKNVILYFQLFVISTYQWLVLYTLSRKSLYAVNTVWTQNYHINNSTEEINKAINFTYYFELKQSPLINDTINVLHFLLTLIYLWIVFLLDSWLWLVWQKNLKSAYGTEIHLYVNVQNKKASIDQSCKNTEKRKSWW